MTVAEAALRGKKHESCFNKVLESLPRGPKTKNEGHFRVQWVKFDR